MEKHLSKEKAKGGRPPKKIKKEKIVMVRLSNNEHFLIEGKAKIAGMRISEWFRRSAKSGKVTPRMNSEDLKAMRTLTGIANNLNQLTKLSHQQGLLLLHRKCRDVADNINSVMQKFFER